MGNKLSDAGNIPDGAGNNSAAAGNNSAAAGNNIAAAGNTPVFPGMNVVLVNPEIPPNTGNIARTCACTGTHLHLVRPLGFDVSEAAIRRAGLDYWKYVDIRYYDSFEEVREAAPEGTRFWFFTTKAKNRYTDVQFQPGDYLVYGRETHGLPEPLLEANYEHCLRVPMTPTLRSLNLANSVALTLYEALRQLDFPGLETEGALTGRPD